MGITCVITLMKQVFIFSVLFCWCVLPWVFGVFARRGLLKKEGWVWERAWDS